MFFRRNYYSPYMTYPLSYTPKPKFDWGNFLSNTQKTIGIINQAIPVVYQLGPIYKNAKTLLRVFNEFNKINSSTNNSNVTNSANNTSNFTNNSAPNFFI